MYKLTLQNVADFAQYWLKKHGIDTGHAVFTDGYYVSTPTEDDVAEYFKLTHEETKPRRKAKRNST